MKLLYGHSRVHKGQHKVADTVSDLWRDVIAKLLQRGQEALEFAQLACPAGGRQLLVGQRRGRGRGRAVAIALRWRWHCVEGWRRMMVSIGQRCGGEGGGAGATGVDRRQGGHAATGGG